MDTLDLSIVIVTWNTEKLILECLSAIYQYPVKINFETILIDNDSKDKTVKNVKAQFPKATLVENSTNIGLIKASNQGFQMAKGRYILWLNSDAILQKDSLDKMIQFMETHPKAGILGPRTFYPDGTLQLSAQQFPTPTTVFLENTYLSMLFKKNRWFGQYLMTWWDHADSREVDWVGGACLLIRRETFQQIGLMDERYALYSTETDWCYLARQKNWQVWYVPNIQVMHYGGQSTKQTSTALMENIRLDLLNLDLLRFMKKYYPPSQVKLAKLFLSFGMYLRMTKWILYYFLPGKRETALSRIRVFRKVLQIRYQDL